MLVTCERLIAIKYTIAYLNLVTARNIKMPVTSCWVFALCCSILRWPFPLFNESIGKTIGKMVVSMVMISCIVFMTTSYVILYKEAALQQNKIETHQLPQEEVERFVKERKALKTTFYVVGAVFLCLSPGTLSSLSFLLEQDTIAYLEPWFRITVMLNSLLNPLIYCWRQKGMRQFVSNVFSSCSSCKLQ